jgi:hypothetical protein
LLSLSERLFAYGGSMATDFGLRDDFSKMAAKKHRIHNEVANLEIVLMLTP